MLPPLRGLQFEKLSQHCQEYGSRGGVSGLAGLFQDTDAALAPTRRLPAPAVRGVAPEDVDPGVGEEAAVLAGVDAARGVALDDELRAGGHVPAAGGGALVDAAAAGHLAAEALAQAVVEGDPDALDAALRKAPDAVFAARGRGFRGG